MKAVPQAIEINFTPFKSVHKTMTASNESRDPIDSTNKQTSYWKNGVFLMQMNLFCHFKFIDFSLIKTFNLADNVSLILRTKDKVMVD